MFYRASFIIVGVILFAVGNASASVESNMPHVRKASVSIAYEGQDFPYYNVRYLEINLPDKKLRIDIEEFAEGQSILIDGQYNIDGLKNFPVTIRPVILYKSLSFSPTCEAREPFRYLKEMERINDQLPQGVPNLAIKIIISDNMESFSLHYSKRVEQN